jgi:hypothetical protein
MNDDLKLVHSPLCWTLLFVFTFLLLFVQVLVEYLEHALTTYTEIIIYCDFIPVAMSLADN